MKGVLVMAGLALAGLALAQYSGQIPCTSETHLCSSGSCSRPVPDGGRFTTADGGRTDAYDAGISLANLKGYTVRICGTEARPLAGAGTMKDYHLIASPANAAEVPQNAQAVTATVVCQEFPPFVIPAFLPAADRMVWASSGVTITNWDGGAADAVTVTVCPVQ